MGRSEESGQVKQSPESHTGIEKQIQQVAGAYAFFVFLCRILSRQCFRSFTDNEKSGGHFPETFLLRRSAGKRRFPLQSFARQLLGGKPDRGIDSAGI